MPPAQVTGKSGTSPPGQGYVAPETLPPTATQAQLNVGSPGGGSLLPFLREALVTREVSASAALEQVECCSSCASPPFSSAPALTAAPRLGPSSSRTKAHPQVYFSASLLFLQV